MSASRRRDGYTLVELLVVISLCSMMLTTVAITMHLLQRVNHQVRSELPQSEALMRLTLHLRTDAHAAERVALEAIPDGSTTARLIRPDGVNIVYGQQGTMIVRRVVRNDQLVHQEQFRCADSAEVTWSTDREPPSIITLEFKRNRGRIQASADAIRLERIEAAIGLVEGVRR